MFSHSKSRINLTTFQGITKVRGGRIERAGPLAYVYSCASSMKNETTGFISSSYLDCSHFCIYTTIEVNGIRNVGVYKIQSFLPACEPKPLGQY